MIRSTPVGVCEVHTRRVFQLQVLCSGHHVGQELEPPSGLNALEPIEMRKAGDTGALQEGGEGEGGVLPGSIDVSLRGMKEEVQNASGIVIATPEYHGGFSAMTKLVIENLGFPSVLQGKPVALLGVAAGRIGAIKSLEQLRGVCSHTGAIVLPISVSIAGVQGAFDEQGNCTDPSVPRSVPRGAPA